MMLKEIYYKILYKLMYGKLRQKYKELYKKAKVYRLSHFQRLKKNEFWLIKENGEKIRNPQIEGLEVEFYGRDSAVEIYEPYNFKNCVIKLGNNNFVQIKGTNYIIMNLKFPCVMRERSQLLIGKDLSCVGCSIYMHDEPDTKVVIGDDCMFSFDIIIWPSDGHAVISDNGEYLNKGEDIIIGNHVWLGMGVNILKGSRIPDNSIVAARSLVLKNSVTSSGGGLFTPPHTHQHRQGKCLQELPLNWSNQETFHGSEKTATITI